MGIENASPSILQQIRLFADSEPHICVWCKWCGAIVTGHRWGFACVRSAEDMTKRHKGAIQPFPVRTGGKFRTRVQCVEPDEHHDCWEPTEITDKRMHLLDALGLLEETPWQTG